MRRPIEILCTLLLAHSCRASLLSDIGNDIKNLFDGSPTSGPSSEPALALAPGLASEPYQELHDLLTNASGPIVYKTAQAALFTFNQSASDGSLYSAADLVQLSGGAGSVLIAWSNGSAILGFQASEELQDEVNGNTSGLATSMPSFLTKVVSGSAVVTGVLSPFEDLLSGADGTSLPNLISELSGGAVPFRILTTGFGAGGGLAQVAAVWAAVTYTGTQIRCITFDAPVVGNNRFAFAFQQFVDLSYVWGFNGTALINTVLRSTENSTGVTPQGLYSQEEYVQAIINAGVYALSNGSKGLSPGIGYEEANSTAPPPDASGLLDAVEQAYDELTKVDSSSDEVPSLLYISDLAEEAPAPAGDAACPLILCKIRPSAAAACGTYNTTVSNTIPDLQAWPGAVEIVAQPYDTHVMVDWSEIDRTAIFVFRGSITEQDWLQAPLLFLDAKLIRESVDFLFPPSVTGIFPDIGVHLGFQEQFRNVWDEAPSPSQNIVNVLNTMRGDAEVQKVVCAGHSLGAAVASICGLWAAAHYPAADVLTVTLGQPFTGDQEYVDAFRMLVGREYRVLLEDRPELPLNDLNWNDHSCYNYSTSLNNAPDVTILSNFTAEVPLSDVADS